MIRLLLVEDDLSVKEMIVDYLSESEEYDITYAKNAEEAMRYLNQAFDVILLDVMLPDGNGVLVCENFRKVQKCPILFISCINDDQVIIDALAHGGDDYITKPFNYVVLDARIKANLRRVRMDQRNTEMQGQTYHKLNVDVENRTIEINGKSMVLGNMEFRILTFFADHPLEYYSSRELYKKLWGKPSLGDTRTVLVHIHNLRKKLESDPANPKIIKSVPGKGYVFDPDGIIKKG